MASACRPGTGDAGFVDAGKRACLAGLGPGPGGVLSWAAYGWLGLSMVWFGLFLATDMGRLVFWVTRRFQRRAGKLRGKSGTPTPATTETPPSHPSPGSMARRHFLGTSAARSIAVVNGAIGLGVAGTGCARR